MDFAGFSSLSNTFDPQKNLELTEVAMTQQPYLMFDLNHSLYGIAADFVQEIFFLPALTDLAESEPDVAGTLS